MTVFLALAFSIAAPAQETGDDPDPLQLFNQGQEAHEKGDFEKALKLYQQAIEVFPEFPEAEYQKGMALLSLNRTDEAEKSLRRAMELRENWTLPMTSLGVLLVQKNEFAEAESLLTKSIQLSGINFLAYSALTDLRIKTNAPPEKLRELLTKIQYLTTKANPTASLWASRAALERKLGDKRSAKISLNRALEIDPYDKLGLAERAETALSEGDYSTALKDVRTLLQMTSGSPHSEFLLARVYAATGDFEQSLAALKSIPDPTPEMLTLRDKIVANSSEDPAQLEKQLETDEKNAVILGRLCVLFRKENPTKALDYCRRAYEAEPDNLSHAVGYGAALVQAQQFPGAVNLLRRILEIAPDNFTAHANLATALFQLKRFEEAKTEYLWIIQHQPDLAIAYYFLAISHDSLEEYLDAMANYQQFLRVADEEQNKLEIEKVNLRLPGLQRLIKQGKGKKDE